MHLHNFGLRLKEIRQYQNISQNELSRKLEISRQAYSNYEQGRCVPPGEILAKLCVLLNSNLIIPLIDAVQFQRSPEERLTPIVNANIVDSDEYQQLTKLYSALPLEARMNILELMQQLAKEES